MNKLIEINEYLENNSLNYIEMKPEEQKLIKIIIEKELKDIREILRQNPSNKYWQNVIKSLISLKSKIKKSSFYIDDFSFDVLMGSVEECIRHDILMINDLYPGIDLDNVDVLFSFYDKWISKYKERKINIYK